MTVGTGAEYLFGTLCTVQKHGVTLGYCCCFFLQPKRYWIAAYSVTTPGLYSCGPNTENTA